MYPLLLLLMLLAAPAWATTYHVATTGNPGNSCGAATSPSTPKLTITDGLTCLAPGDTLLVHAGTYAERLLNLIPSGSAGAPTILKANGNAALGTGETVILKPGVVAPYTSVVSVVSRSYITLDGFVIDATNIFNTAVLAAGTAHHITIQNCHIRNMEGHAGDNNGGAGIDFDQDTTFNTAQNNVIHDIGTVANPDTRVHGIYIHGQNHTIQDNISYNNAGMGIHLYDGSGFPVSNNTVRNNLLYGNGSNGMLVGSGDNNLAYNNIVRNNGATNSGYGISVGFGTTTNTKIYNNTVYQNANNCINIGSGSGANVRNNICYQNGSDVVNNGGTGSTVSNNLLGTDPQFVNAGAGDFHLTTGSPAIGAGATLSAVATDFGGTARTAPYDQGAWKFGTPAPVVQQRLAQWLYPEGTGTSTVDQTGNAHTGTLTLGATWGPGRVARYATVFDGVDDSVAVAGLWGGATALTLSTWVKVDAITDGRAEVMSLGDYVVLYVDATKVEGFYWQGSTWIELPFPATRVGTGWFHLTYVVDPTASAQRLYVNGVLRASGTSSAALNWAGLGTNTALGKHGQNASRWLQGSMGDTRISNFALTDAEVLLLYRQTAGQPRHRMVMR